MKKLSFVSDPSLLRQQLLAALRPPAAGVKGADDIDPWRFRTPLRLLVGEAWRCVIRSDFAALREFLRILVEAQEVVRPDLPEQGSPEVEAAREVHYMTWVLHVAEASLRPAKTEANLRDRRRSDSERKVLRVLFENRQRYLRRGEIQDEMERLLPPPHPEATRISQILSDLWDERLLTRMVGSAQGNRQTSFFALSRQGLELCRELSIADPQPLFETNEAKWRHMLRRTELASNPERPEGKEGIAAFYRPRPGVGCSLALAHCAVALADNLLGRQVLVLDLEGEESSLPDHLKVERLSALRGLGGLFEDYYVQPESERRAWLEANLLDERYASRVWGQKNLFYLPAIQHKQDSDSSYLYATLLDGLRREIYLQPKGKGATQGFIGDLRFVLHNVSAKTLIQAPSGLGPGAYFACVLLAEELVLFLRPDDVQREGIRRILRPVVGTSLLHRRGEPALGLAPIFVFSRLAVEAKLDPATLIDHLLINSAREEGESRSELNYRIVRLHDDDRLIQGAALLDLSSNRSLLGKGYWNLIEILHPDSSFIPSHYRREDEEMEQLRELAVQEQPSLGLSVWGSAHRPDGQGSIHGDPVPGAGPSAPADSLTSYFPQRPDEDLNKPIEAALKNAGLSRVLNEPVLVGAW